MHPRPSSVRTAVALLALAAIPAVAGAQARSAVTPVRPVPAPEPRYIVELEGGVGITAVDKMKWAGTVSALDDWNTTAYTGGARLFFKRAGSAWLGVEAGYEYFWWYTTSAAGYAITYEPAATRVGVVARAPVGSRVAFDGGVAAYIFEGGTNVGVNAALGYFIPAGKRWSIPLRVRGDVVFGSGQTFAAALATAGLQYRF